MLSKLLSSSIKIVVESQSQLLENDWHRGIEGDGREHRRRDQFRRSREDAYRLLYRYRDQAPEDRA